MVERLIDVLGLRPHPEGGMYAETWRGPAGPDGRATATAIYFLLRAGERSQWHRVDASEVWLWHHGVPVDLSIGSATVRLGPDVLAGERPQAVVPAGAWQAAAPVTSGPDDWALVSCVVAPGFDFSGFELAPEGFQPPG